MNVSLTTELEEFVSRKVETGTYRTASEVVREGLRLLKEREERLEALRRDVRTGFEAVDRGDFIDLDVDRVNKLAERVKARGMKRLGGQKRKPDLR